MNVCRYCDQGFGLHTGDCPSADRPPPPGRKPASSRYVPPSRAGRPSRSEYLSAVGSSPERKAELHRAKQARYRARKKAAAA